MNRELKAFLAGFLAVVAMTVSIYILKTVISGKRNKVSSSTDFNLKRIQQKSSVKKKPKPKKKVVKNKLKPVFKNNFKSSEGALGSGFLDSLIGGSQFLNESSNAAVAEGAVDDVPVVLSRPELTYPDEALEKKINGKVELSVLVNKNGQVEAVKIISSKPGKFFDLAAIDFVKQWIFTPAKIKGQAVNVWVKQVIEFRLN